MSGLEPISHSKVKAGDVIVLPASGGGVMRVIEVLPADVGGLRLQVSSPDGQQEVIVRWRDEILRVAEPRGDPE